MRAGRGRLAVTGCWDGLLKQMARLPCADCFKSQSERAVGAGRGRPVMTGRWDKFLKQMARLPCADCFKSQSELAVGAGRGRTSVTGRCDYRQRIITGNDIPRLMINNTLIELVTEFNFLGLTVNEYMNWNSHTKKIANKISRTLGVMNRLKRYFRTFAPSIRNYKLGLWMGSHIKTAKTCPSDHDKQPV